MAVISAQPWYKGQTFPTALIPLTTDDGDEDLTGVDITKFTMILRNTTASPPVDTTGTGTFSIAQLTPAEVYYKFSVADVATAFSGELVIEALFPPSGTTADRVIWDPIPFSITDV